MENSNKVVLKAAGFGGGFALVAAIIIGAVMLWSHRAGKPKPWNPNAIIATYNGLSVEGDKNTFVYSYILENRTSTDYQIPDDVNVHLAVKYKDSESLNFPKAELLHLDYPIFIPARSKVAFQVHLAQPSPFRRDYDASEDVQHDFNTRLAQYATKNMGSINGFEVLDDNSRYQLNLPSGWAERAKMPMRVNAPATPK
jgi:hypothetical protein